jgi:hypothetical protein
VILDRELAAMYAVPTKVLIQAVKRNSARFPGDFMFQLSSREFRILRSQIVTSSLWGGRRTAPYAFTEQGVAMLSTVLRSRRAIGVNIEIMRAFVRLRRMMAKYEDLGRRIDALEKRTDGQFEVVFDAIRALVNVETKPKRRIGYLAAGEPGAQRVRASVSPLARAEARADLRGAARAAEGAVSARVAEMV